MRSLIATLGLFSVASAVVLPTRTIEENVKRQDEGNASTESVKFFGWEGCSTADAPDGSNVIEAAWQSMLEIGNAVKGNIHFDGQAEIEFLGAKEKNTDQQVNMQHMIENTITWTKGGLLSWAIHMRCDDYLRGAITDPSEDCPANTAKEDRSKCRSRCWRPIANTNPTKWEYNARAYVTNGHSTSPVATINFCPGFFKLDTCETVINKWGGSGSPQNKLDLFNYQCQGYAAMHELFHIDANWQNVAYGNGHVYDRRMQVKHDGKLLAVPAYSPYWAKVLANWGGSNVGKLVSTNADNLAQYALAKYVQSKINDYPKFPVVTRSPATDPAGTRPQMLFNVNGDPTLASDADLIQGMSLNGDETDPVYDALEMKKDTCSDADTEESCIDDGGNPIVILAVDDTMPTLAGDASAPPATTSAAAQPSYTGTPAVCNCNENGCSDDSPACCADNTCA